LHITSVRPSGVASSTNEGKFLPCFIRQRPTTSTAEQQPYKGTTSAANMVKRVPKRRQDGPPQHELDASEIRRLEERIAAEAPARGTTPPLSQTVAFRALVLSEATQRGLESAEYTIMTAIQNACIPHALAGRDILGAAKTGSGKTLAYLVPLLEALYRARIQRPADGLGAVVLAPTRELAVQIFQVLQKIGKHHGRLAVGLLIGGKADFFAEQQRLGQTNLVIATPGRLLQHCEQTPYLDWGNLTMIVLDEADRILDMGFREQLVRLLDYLPTERQTLLFSATQTRDVKQLATLSLNQPEYLGVHDQEATSTPASLQQSYVVVPLKDKLNAVYSFLKSHLQHKTIFFFSTCAQVQHAYELFCSLRPGVPIVALHGKLAQSRRTAVYMEFLKRPQVALLATDVCSRGLDFPNVDWVIQVDSPEDRDMYIHRAGRTARYRAGGKALLFLTPQESRNGYVDKVLQSGNKQSKLIPIKKASINPNKTVVVGQRAASLVAEDKLAHQMAKKAFSSHIRSLQLMPSHPDIFHVADKETLDSYASSLGLASTPRIRTVEGRDGLRAKKNVNRKLQKLKDQIKAEKLAKKVAKLGKQPKRPEPKDDEEDDDDDLLVSKGIVAWNDGEGDLPDAKIHEASQRPSKKIRTSSAPTSIRINGPSSSENKRIVFQNDEDDDSDGGPEESNATENLAAATDAYAQRIRERLERNKEEDRAQEQDRVRQKHRKLRLQDKEEREEEDGPVAVLGGFDGEPADGESSSSVDSDSDSDDEKGDTQSQEAKALALIRGR
jgi:ATP-dependent RNA helicase DDX10/DBP4